MGSAEAKRDVTAESESIHKLHTIIEVPNDTLTVNLGLIIGYI